MKIHSERSEIYKQAYKHKKKKIQVKQKEVHASFSSGGCPASRLRFHYQARYTLVTARSFAIRDSAGVSCNWLQLRKQWNFW